MNRQEVNASLPTVNIKGNPYVTVDSRVEAFWELYPTGSIITEVKTFDAGLCMVKASVLIDGEVKSTGHAFENQSASYINKTSFLENCVPIDTQILTPDGWRYYYQIKAGDKVWSLNMETMTYEIATVEAINVYANRPLVRLESSRFSFTCTPEHKWIVREQYKSEYKEATKNLRKRQKIVSAVMQDAQPSIAGRKLGWLMCDCEIRRTEAGGMPSTAYITQSKHIQDITELFGAGRLVKKYDDSWADCFEWVIPATDVRMVLGMFGIASYSDLAPAMAKADIEDVAGCYRSMMLADGESRGFSSTYIELVEAVQIMCARLGIATTHIKSRRLKNSTKPIYTLGIKKTDGAWVSELDMKPLPPADVWCPTTSTGTWFAKQGDFVTLTSNCETSAVGRALGFLGIGLNGSIASADEVATAIEQQEIKPKPKDRFASYKAAAKAATDAGIPKDALKSWQEANVGADARTFTDEQIAKCVDHFLKIAADEQSLGGKDDVQ